VLAKLVWDVNDHHTLRLTYDHFDQDMDGEALSGYSATVVGLTAHDETQRDRVSLDWRFDDVLGLDSGSVTAFWQDSTRAPVHL
jgi:hemoglobin/transferrin/lactoferrin receptor protein